MTDRIKNSNKLQISKNPVGAYHYGICPFCYSDKNILPGGFLFAGLSVDYEKQAFKCLNKYCYKEGTFEELLEEIDKE
jgi:hypothetical protein